MNGRHFKKLCDSKEQIEPDCNVDIVDEFCTLLIEGFAWRRSLPHILTWRPSPAFWRKYAKKILGAMDVTLHPLSNCPLDIIREFIAHTHIHRYTELRWDDMKNNPHINWNYCMIVTDIAEHPERYPLLVKSVLNIIAEIPPAVMDDNVFSDYPNFQSFVAIYDVYIRDTIPQDLSLLMLNAHLKYAKFLDIHPSKLYISNSPPQAGDLEFAKKWGLGAEEHFMDWARMLNYSRAMSEFYDSFRNDLDSKFIDDFVDHAEITYEEIVHMKPRYLMSVEEHPFYWYVHTRKLATFYDKQIMAECVRLQTMENKAPRSISRTLVNSLVRI